MQTKGDFVAETFQFDSNAEAVKNAIFRHYAHGNFARCIVLLQERLNNDTNKEQRYYDTSGYYAQNVEYLVLLSGCYYKLGSVEQAEEIYYNILTFANNDIELLLSLLEYDPKSNGEDIVSRICDFITYIPKELRPYGRVDASRVDKKVLSKILFALEKSKKMRGFSVSSKKAKNFITDLEFSMIEIGDKIYSGSASIEAKEKRLIKALKEELAKYPESEATLKYAIQFLAEYSIECVGHKFSKELLLKLYKLNPDNTISLGYRMLDALLFDEEPEVARQLIEDFIARYSSDFPQFWIEFKNLCARILYLGRFKECNFLTRIVYDKYPLHCGIMFTHFCVSKMSKNKEQCELTLEEGLKYYPQTTEFIFAKRCTNTIKSAEIMGVVAGNFVQLAKFRIDINNYRQRMYSALIAGKKAPKLPIKIGEAIEILLQFGDFDNSTITTVFEHQSEYVTNIFMQKLASPLVNSERKVVALEMLVHYSNEVISGTYLKGNKLLPVKINPLFQEETGQSYAIIKRAYAHAHCGLINKYEYVETDLLLNIACKMGEFYKEDANIGYLAVIMMYVYERQFGQTATIEHIASVCGLDLVILLEHIKAFGLEDVDKNPDDPYLY